MDEERRQRMADELRAVAEELRRDGAQGAQRSVSLVQGVLSIIVIVLGFGAAGFNEHARLMQVEWRTDEVTKTALQTAQVDAEWKKTVNETLNSISLKLGRIEGRLGIDGTEVRR